MGAYLNNIEFSQSHLPQFKLNKDCRNQQRLSDDSLKLLLLNRSNTQNIIDPIIFATKSTSFSQENHEISSKTRDNALNTSSKVNEYCYIQANGQVNGGPEVFSNVGCSFQVNVDLRDSKMSPFNSNVHSPTLNESNIATSTPSVPKSLPPSMSNSKSGNLAVENDYDYEPLTNTSCLNTYRTCYDESDKMSATVQETVENDDESNESNPDYQIPSNMVLN